eukprot:339130-Rhodomonas_salina.3
MLCSFCSVDWAFEDCPTRHSAMRAEEKGMQWVPLLLDLEKFWKLNERKPVQYEKSKKARAKVEVEL